MLLRVRGLVVSLSLLAAPGALAANSEGYQVGFGPFVGGGTISTGARVRHTSGYALSVERNWALTEKTTLGPRIEVANAFVNTRATGEDDAKQLGTYDNRIVSAGFTLTRDVGNQGTFAQAVYLTGLLGRGYSKLSIDESTERTFKQSLYGNMSGTWLGGELGAWIPLKGDFGLTLAALGNVYKVNQGAACGTYDGDQVAEDGSLSLTQGSYGCGTPALASQAVMRTVAAKLALSLGF